eukprot:RCo036652
MGSTGPTSSSGKGCSSDSCLSLCSLAASSAALSSSVRASMRPAQGEPGSFANSSSRTRICSIRFCSSTDMHTSAVDESRYGSTPACCNASCWVCKFVSTALVWRCSTRRILFAACFSSFPQPELPAFRFEVPCSSGMTSTSLAATNILSSLSRPSFCDPSLSSAWVLPCGEGPVCSFWERAFSSSPELRSFESQQRSLRICRRRSSRVRTRSWTAGSSKGEVNWRLKPDKLIKLCTTAFCPTRFVRRATSLLVLPSGEHIDPTARFSSGVEKEIASTRGVMPATCSSILRRSRARRWASSEAVSSDLNLEFLK